MKGSDMEMTKQELGIIDVMENHLAPLDGEQAINVTGNLFCRVLINVNMSEGNFDADMIRDMAYKMVDLIVDQNVGTLLKDGLTS